DHHVLQNAARYPDVNLLNTMGFLDGMMKSGLWEGLGLDKEANIREVMDDIGHQSELANGTEDQGYTANTDYTSSQYRQCMNREAIANIACPFEESQCGLVHDLGWNEKRAELDACPTIPPISRVEMFGRR